MKKLHAIGGAPRSGSTLLKALLCQNPRFWASSTSALCDVVAAAANVLSASPEVKSDLRWDQRITEERSTRVLRDMVESWYDPDADPRIQGKEVIIDKGRGWTWNLDLLQHLRPEAKLLVCVRDPRDVLCSVHRRYQRFPVYDEARDLSTLEARRDRLFAAQGMAGRPLLGIRDLIQRRHPGAFFIKYEEFVTHPERVMRQVYGFLEEPWFPHDFDDVIDVSTDDDAAYGFLFPHQVAGPVEPPPEEAHWSNHFDRSVADPILRGFPIVCKAFGYGEGP